MKKEVSFKLCPGQVDMTKLRHCPVVGCAVVWNRSILLVERSQKVAFYKGYWTGPFGFLDDLKTVRQKVYEEICAEIGIPRKDIISLTLSEPFANEDKRGRKVFIVFPAKVEVRSSEVRIDWEATNYKWVDSVAESRLRVVPSFYRVLSRFGLS